MDFAMGISLAIDEDVVVRTPDDFMAMPEDYCEVALRQMLVNTEGELSGGDDYVQVFFAGAEC
jgi:ring-1,2-phenylacetyl-CoA epoxidase subunit PaaA